MPIKGSIALVLRTPAQRRSPKIGVEDVGFAGGGEGGGVRSPFTADKDSIEVEFRVQELHTLSPKPDTLKPAVHMSKFNGYWCESKSSGGLQTPHFPGRSQFT